MEIFGGNVRTVAGGFLVITPGDWAAPSVPLCRNWSPAGIARSSYATPPLPSETQPAAAASSSEPPPCGPPPGARWPAWPCCTPLAAHRLPSGQQPPRELPPGAGGCPPSGCHPVLLMEVVAGIGLEGEQRAGLGCHHQCAPRWTVWCRAHCCRCLPPTVQSLLKVLYRSVSVTNMWQGG